MINRARAMRNRFREVFSQLPGKYRGILDLYYLTPGLARFDRTSKIRALARILDIRWSKNPEALIKQWLARARGYLKEIFEMKSERSKIKLWQKNH